jgi:hypothetical protein
MALKPSRPTMTSLLLQQLQISCMSEAHQPLTGSVLPAHEIFNCLFTERSTFSSVVLSDLLLP